MDHSQYKFAADKLPRGLHPMCATSMCDKSNRTTLMLVVVGVL